MAAAIITIIIPAIIYGVIAYLADKQERETSEHNQRVAWRRHHNH